MAGRGLPALAGRLLGRIAPQVGKLVESVGPAAQLARSDGALARAWWSHQGALREELGEGEARAYTELLVALSTGDPRVAREVARSLPDQLARVEPGARPRYISLLKAVARDRVEALPLVIRTLPALLGRLPDESLARYLAEGIELHRRSPARAESWLRMESGQGQQQAAKLVQGIALADLRRTLTGYARAHCGESVQIRPGGDQAFTDGRHIYLPERVHHFGDERDFLIYRVLTARNAGYIEFGTLDLELDQLPAPRGEWPERRSGEVETERLMRAYDNPSIARDLFTILENLRVEARVRAEYPGVARDMERLQAAWRPDRPETREMSPAELAIEALARRAMGLELPQLYDPRVVAALEQIQGVLPSVSRPGATVQDTIAALSSCYPMVDGLTRRVDPDTLRGLDPMGSGGEGGGKGRPGEERGEAQVQQHQPGPRTEDRDLSYRPMQADPFGPQLRTEGLDSAEREVEDRARELLDAMRQAEATASLSEARKQARKERSSYEEMAAFLERLEAPAGPMRESGAEQRESERMTAAQGLALDTEPGPGRSFVYPEWDATIEDHKPNWVRLTEYRLEAGSADFVERVRRDFGPEISELRRAFEALRPEGMRRVRGLEDGDEIDLDRAIRARLERRAGSSPDPRIYTRHVREERDVAVAFLVDMSSSTNEVINTAVKRIIEVEKEALVLIAEAADAIGDSSAIWGFSGYGRDQVAFYIAKDFGDRWDDRVAERIGRMSWKMENRDGAAIRHATWKLGAQKARVRLLILLSDGRPLDCGCDHYADRYAQEDTRQALREARQKGIHPFCITVDPQGQRYLGRMYGDGAYTVIDRVEKLPRRIPEIYRKLTR